LRKGGAPLAIMPPPKDKLPVFTASEAIFKGAPHPNAARLYVAWYLAKEQQARTGSYSPRHDVAPPEGFKPLSAYRLANNYREFVLDDALITKLRKRFEAHTGPIKNQGGVQ
jgi:ABC-type Fe3+ transport system substrate-binding protein